MSNERRRCNPGITDVRECRDELRLAHEAASAELIACRARLRGAETKRASDVSAYQAALDATRAQRDRVVTLVDQIRVAEAHLTLAEAAAPASKAYRLSSRKREPITAPTGGAR